MEYTTEELQAIIISLRIAVQHMLHPFDRAKITELIEKTELMIEERK